MSHFFTLLSQLAPDVPGVLSRPAVARIGGELSYDQLRAGAIMAELLLDRHGAGAGEIVALPSGFPCGLLSWPALVLAVLRGGRIYLPIEPELPIGPQVEAVSPTWLLVPEASYPRWAPGLPDHEIVDLLPPPGTGDPALCLIRFHSARPALPADAAYLIPTSGSAGRPKVVLGSLAGLGHFIDWEIEALHLRPRVRVSQLTPPSFDPMLRDLFVPLAVGGTLCLPSSQQEVLDPPALADWLHEADIGLVHCVPTIFRSLLSQPLSSEWFPRLRHVLIAGEPLFPSDVRRWLAIFGERVQLMNLYGPTETTLAKFAHWISPQDCRGERVPVGKPISGAAAIVLGEDLRVCAPHEIGEVYIRTPYWSHGYLDQPEMTRAVFVQNPFSSDPADRVYRTGDLGFVREDGLFELVGRSDDMVKVRGARLHLSFIEAAIRRLDGVEDAALKVWQDERNPTLVCAYVVASRPFSLQMLREELLRSVPPSMLPQAVVSLCRLPRNLHGKVDRGALPRPAPADLPAEAAEAPRNRVETALLGIWREVLPRAGAIGIDQTIHQLGGQSIEAAQIAGRINRHFGTDVQLRELLELGSIAAMAPLLAWRLTLPLSEERWQAAADRLAARLGPERALPPAADRRALVYSLAPAELDILLEDLPIAPQASLGTSDEPAPLSFAQRRFFHLEQGQPGNPSLNHVWAAILRGPLDPERLAGALRQVVGRHPALRTAIRAAEGGAVQTAAVSQEIFLPWIDLQHLPPRVRGRELLARAREAARRRFEIGRDLLLRSWLFRLGSERYFLLLSGHVIVSDGWSKTLLLKEIAALYTSPDTELPPLPASFADFARWESERAPAMAHRHEPYWREQLGDRLLPLELPYDRPRSRALNSEGDSVWFSLPGCEIRGLTEIAAAHGTTRSAAVLSCFVLALALWSHRDELRLVLPHANRPLQEVEPLFGCFTDSFLFHRQVAWNETFESFVRETGRQLAEALTHAEMPLELVMDRLFPDADRYDPDLLPVMFAPQPAMAKDFSLPGLRSREVVLELWTTIFNLHLFTFDRASRVDLRLTFSAEVFRRFSIESLAHRMRKVAGSCVLRSREPLLHLKSLA